MNAYKNQQANEVKEEKNELVNLKTDRRPARFKGENTNVVMKERKN